MKSLCLRQTRFPVVLNKFNNKKQVLFNLGFELENRLDINSFIDFKRQWNLAKVGLSQYSYLNNSEYIRDKDYELVNWTRVPCGICSSCLQMKAKEWALRISLQAKISKNNQFVTFTYSDEYLPKDRMVSKKAMQDMLKRLRKALFGNEKGNLMYYLCGEYGSTTARPHYHAIFFNLPLNDLKYYSKTKNGDVLYTSAFMSKIWPYGEVWIGEVTYSSACYVAHYVDKKQLLTALEKKELKKKGIEPEFSLMSLRPAIASEFTIEVLDRLSNDYDYRIMYKGKSYPVPSYFTRKFKNNLTGSDLECYNEHMQYVADIQASKIFDEADQRGVDVSTIIDSDTSNYHLRKNKRKEN